MNRRRTPAVLGAAGVLLAGGLLTGCEQSQEPQSLSAKEVSARYGYDVEQATMTPVFALVPQFRDPTDGYARELLGAICLEGVVEYRPTPPGETGDPTFDERTFQTRFDEEIAHLYGYPVLRTFALADTAVPDSVPITDEIHAAMVACGEKTNQRLGRPPERVLNVIEATGWMAVEGDATVAKASDRWQQCMAPVGLIDLPDNPSLMPSPSLSSGMPQEGQPLSDSTEHGVSAWEREVAVADARCRVESGYDRALLQARATAELEAIAADIEAFESARIAFVEYQKGVDAVIAEFG